MFAAALPDLPAIYCAGLWFLAALGAFGLTLLCADSLLLWIGASPRPRRPRPPGRHRNPAAVHRTYGTAFVGRDGVCYPTPTFHDAGTHQ